jgi:uncharacterized protein YlxP (DUF503 family)
MRVAICLLEIHIPAAGSLKSKRQVLMSLIQRLRNQFNLSVTEVGCQDLWQHAELGLAVVCHNGAGADSILEQIFSFVENDSRVNIISSKVEIY